MNDMPTLEDSSSQASSGKPSLDDALEDVFATRHVRSFAEKLTRFSQALTNAHWTCLIVMPSDADAPFVLVGDPPATQKTALLDHARDLLGTEAGEGSQTRAIAPNLMARVALSDASLGVLVVGLAQQGKVQSALAYERLVFLSGLSFARNRPADRLRQDALIIEMQKIASGEVQDLSQLTDMLCEQTGANYAAVARARDGAIENLKISGQDQMAKRASLPETLRKDMRDTVRQRLQSSERAFAAAAERTDGLVLHVDSPTKNQATVQQLAGLFAMAQGRGRHRRVTTRGLVKMASFALVLFGIGLIPLPDNVELPALVQAKTQRVVTAPNTATLNRVLVVDGAQVRAGETILFELDNSETQAELIGARAEQAKALLEREAARAARNAASLRNAELEVDRLAARIALLELRQSNASVIAPISGRVVAPDLQERQGTSVRLGEELLTIADPAELRLKLSIPEHQIGRLADGDTGIFRPDFDPSLRMDARVTLISPANLGEGSETMFLGRASLDNVADGMRPGLQGVLAVQRESQPLAVIVYRAVRDYVLLKLWV